jgi:hypothetical protein
VLATVHFHNTAEGIGAWGFIFGFILFVTAVLGILTYPVRKANLADPMEESELIQPSGLERFRASARQSNELGRRFNLWAWKIGLVAAVFFGLLWVVAAHV